MRKFILSNHAYNKINGDAELAKAVLDAADNPSVTYGVTTGRNRDGQRQMRHIRNGMAVVVDPVALKVITFYPDVEETDIRPDQADDPEAQRYARERAASDRAKRDAKRAAKRERDRAFTSAQKSGGKR